MVLMTVDVTVLVAARNEEINLSRCLDALRPARRVILLDSRSTDRSAEIASENGAEVVQFEYHGGYPRKRQWALDTLSFDTEWVLLIDADEVIPKSLWEEIASATRRSGHPDAYLISKGFHFMGRRFRFGGFSHQAVLLFRCGKARFEDLGVEVADDMDMEVHERVIVNGPIGRLRTALIHEDFKGLEAYIDRHNRYATWEAALRMKYPNGKGYGDAKIQARLFGNTQERRRFLKKCILRMPGEPLIWFLYHYCFCMGFLEGQPGWLACRIRMSYISRVRNKMREERLSL